MTFIHGYLLGGLLLAGVPVLLHLLMRQKPRRLRFPAFRFLKARQRTNQRKLRLQHLLLLLLRVLVVAALCLALARPRVFSSRVGLEPGARPVAMVFLFDTSASMGYEVGGVSRLQESQQRAGELLDQTSAGSRVAVLDSGDDADDVLLGPAEARARVAGLLARPGAAALNRPVERALRLLAAEPAGAEDPPRFLYVFSDRTRACWDPAGAKPAVPEGVSVLFVDVGVDTPRDLAVEKIEVPAVLAPGVPFQARVSVRGTPGGHVNELSFQIDNDPDPERAADRRPVQLAKDQTGDVFEFERVAPTPSPASAASGADVPYQITVRLGTRDALPFNDVRYATFLVRPSKRLLTLVAADPGAALVWQRAQLATRTFAPEVRTFAQAAAISDKDFSRFPVVALFEATEVPAGLAARLTRYVKGGGSLVVVPAGEDLAPHLRDFNDRLARDLLPAPLAALADAPADRPVGWRRFTGRHPLLAPFAAWEREGDVDFARAELRPFARRYWKLGPLAPGGAAIAAYADASGSPALAERTVGKGKVLLFTTPLDPRRRLDPKKAASPQWTNYLESSFVVVLIDRVCRYLAGESAVPELNFRCGQTPFAAVPAPREPPYTLAHPAMAGVERNLKIPETGPVLAPQAAAPGNYLVRDGKDRPVAGFSLNVDPRESDLGRVPAEELNAVLGKDAVLPVGRSASLADALAATRPPPVELLPYLMMLLLVVLTLESLLANRFYRQPASEAPGKPVLLRQQEDGTDREAGRQGDKGTAARVS
jgi:hypothetical protein